jgi:uncharacterized membrane protein
MNRALSSLIGGLAMLVVVLLFAGGQGSDLSLSIGRLHPSIVHLPIGILLVALGLDGLARMPRFAGLAATTPVVLLAGAWSAIVAAVLGLLLADERGYVAGTLEWHKRIGIALAVAATVAYALRAHGVPNGRSRSWYRASVALLFVGLVIGGHLGGMLTHGEGYLTRHLPDAVRLVAGLPPKRESGRRYVANPDSASVYAALIQPILNDRCASCHSAERKKGGLALDSWDGLKAGGKDGKVLAAGRSEESEMIRRIWLPPGHPDKMPPEDPISIAEAELIRWWIDRGASEEVKLTDIERTPGIREVLDAYGLDDLPTGIFTLKVAPADSASVSALRKTGLMVQPLGANAAFLQVLATNVRQSLGTADLEAIRPLAQQVAWVDLADTKVNDSTLALLSTLPHLTRLHLENTLVTDAGLAHLKGLRYLEYLNLYNTRVSDTGLRSLDSLSRLRSLYVWGTHVTPEGAASLKRALPKVVISLGGSLPAPPAAPPTPSSRGK